MFTRRLSCDLHFLGILPQQMMDLESFLMNVYLLLMQMYFLIFIVIRQIRGLLLRVL
ncbi:hypothetical protein O166_23065 [Pseudogulbenkiania ferrooxidans EGD-HP2]|uniref:Uncharacterized protein n=1 Tax=Pseudogulbenkiania ferrooxidans EGD-HP2 TaxID=1388764 RepID=A0ABN0N9R4_9NEIS|nr:hypothetical protein O166_23065 [Pseudogulbenkiania ferrooxidans EGD-HP2]